MKSVIVEALDEVCQGYSPDRVVADPELNAQFVAARRKRGLADNVAELNRALFNLRKRRELRGRPRATRTSFADQTNYQFAAEMAIRFIERRDSVSLDDVICDLAFPLQTDPVFMRESHPGEARKGFFEDEEDTAHDRSDY